MQSIFKPLAPCIVMAALLAGCGSSDETNPVGSDQQDNSGSQQQGDGDAQASGFGDAQQMAVLLPAPGQSVCLDLDGNSQSPDCSGAAWDIKVTSSGRSASLYSNSGSSGSGQGGVFGSPLDWTWAELQTYPSGQETPAGEAISPRLYVADAATGAFSSDAGSSVGAAFEYGLNDTHLLYPTYRVFLVTSDSSSADAIGTAASPVYAVQIIGYYGGASGSESGHISLRWIDRRFPGSVNTAVIDATGEAGPAYFDLGSGTVVDASGNWQIAFQRFNVLLNGGDSGSGSVGGFLARTPVGLYDDSGEPVTQSFLNADPAVMLAELTGSDLEAPASERDWVVDEIGSLLSPAYTGTYPGALNFGLYSYYPTADAASAAGLPATAHLLGANSSAGALIRSGEGSSFVRFRLLGIDYADSADSGSQQTWRFEYAVQPTTEN